MPALLLALLAPAARAHDCDCVEKTPAAARDVVRRSGKGGLVNPLLDVESSIEFSELQPFQHKVEAFIERAASSGTLTHASVYFRDLNNGPLFGIQSSEKFAPASLLKVPLMIALLKQEEEDPGYLKQRVAYAPPDFVTPMVSTQTLRKGEIYTLEQLMRAMIVNSDNGAALILRAVAGGGAMEEVYRDLGLIIPDVRGPDDNMTVREYATFFRILYNASYLDRKRSEKALALLTESRFKQGITAGLPAGMIVAHKFGERYTHANKARQLHDCGIVYYPARPYLLCIMTRGEDFDKQTAVIRGISGLVYREVSQREATP